MGSDTGKSASIMLSHTAASGGQDACRAWHRKVTELAQGADGLVASDIFEPIDGVQDEWVHIIRFASVEQLRALVGSSAFKVLLDEAETMIGAPISKQVIADAGTSTAPVTVVISQLVKPECTDDYIQWRKEMDRAVRPFAGFRSSETIAPVEGVQDEWVLIYRFDSTPQLEAWLNSDIRKKMLERAEPFFERVDFHRVGRGFEDWFGNASGETTDGRPPQWKMAMIILLALYPTIMLLTLFLLPQIAGWPRAYAVFVSNVCSVLFLTWVAMPAVTRLFRPWLADTGQSGRRVLILGTGTIVALYGALVALFAVVGRL
ncbi:antibiotic biosynthesis monooxygenase [Nitratireductor sp. XY-223]|uniref:antibiotic biosynthesis monooxygenase n=1 Tax=Nitratireductor sp. XY-223 TaxID=2561926 RepID=UPI0010AB3704|nr:antibiotic biosynthesis monooxygenase [Nitratireductor sp. XY-223]